MVSIIIADAHILCREALCNYIREADPDCRVDGVGDYESLCREAVLTGPDLILVDHDLLNLKDDALRRDFLNPKLPVKIGMMVTDPQRLEIMEPHIRGVFPKNLSSKNFMDGIHEILAGRPFYPHIQVDVNSHTHLPITTLRQKPDDYGLTQREREVMSFLLKGASNKDIARALDLQVVTVKLHVRRICRKMKAANRTQAAIIAKENGWN